MEVIDKSVFKDSNGRYITQGLFLELGYKTDNAVYTLDDEDKTYKGVVYPSLKRLYLEMSDVTEYEFSRAHLCGWQHWKRISANKIIAPHIEDWREELELALRAEGLQTIITAASNSDSFAAGKWLVDRGWIKRAAGRPSKNEVADALEKDKKLSAGFQQDFELLEMHKGA